MRIPKVGDQVMVVGVKSNGIEEQLGFVTRVHALTKDGWDINVSILLDGSGCDSRKHVRTFESRELAVKHRDNRVIAQQETTRQQDVNRKDDVLPVPAPMPGPPVAYFLDRDSGDDKSGDLEILPDNKPVVRV